METIVLIAIIVEIYSLVRHAQLEHKVEDHMKLLDEHIKQLDEHLFKMDRHLNMQNPGPEDEGQ